MAKEKKKKGVFFRGFLYLLMGSSLILMIAAAIIFIKVKNYVEPFYNRAQTYDLNKIDEVEIPSIIYDRNGIEIGRIYAQNRSVVPLDEIPETVIDCLIAQEDQRFWEHEGVDWVGLARGLKLNLEAGRSTQGASTIAMQLSRNVFNLKGEALERDERGIERKIVEICVALRIGDLYSSPSGKRYILECYLNRVNFGHGYYGIRSASLGFYGKEPKDLETHEAASLVACIKNPSAISPIRFPETNKKARDHVFRRLLAEEVITQEEHNKLVEIPIKLNQNPLKRQTSYMYEKINDEVKKLLGEENFNTGGLRIFTTIDSRVQKNAEKALADQLTKIESSPGYSHPKYAEYKSGEPRYLQGGILVSDPQTGMVIAHVGGRNFSHNQFDFIDSAARPVGTAILPFLYSYALEQGYNAASILSDTALNNRLVMIGGLQGILGEWGQETLVPFYEGDITIRRALEMSKVSASIRLGRELGISNFVEFCDRFEMDFPEEEELLTRDLLGWNPMSIREVSSAYSSFSNEGKRLDKYIYVDRIEAREGKPLYIQGKSDERNGYTQVLKPTTAFTIYDILRKGFQKNGNLASINTSLLSNEFQGAAKTGTPYSFADAWAVGFDKNYVCTTWIGFKKGKKAILPNGFAKDLAMPIVSNTMATFDLGNTANEVAPPLNITTREICKVSGELATRYCCVEDLNDPEKVITTIVTEYFTKDNAPKELCSLHLGVGEGKFGDKFAPAEGESIARPVLSITSITPKTAGVVGGDPYETVKNAQGNGEEDKLPESYTSSILILNDEVSGGEDAKIELPTPKKLSLKVNTTKIHPSFLKAE